MNNRASTAALRRKLQSCFSYGKREPRHPASGFETVRNRRFPMICRFVLWGTLIFRSPSFFCATIL